jgi:PAS domain S-box-containing protein
MAGNADARTSSPEPDDSRKARELIRTLIVTLALALSVCVAAVAFVWTGLDGLPAPHRYGGLAVLGGLLATLGFFASRAWHAASALVRPGTAPPPAGGGDGVPWLEENSPMAGIIASAMDAIITVGEDQRIVLFNRMAETVFGWRADEVLGQPLDRLLPARFRPGHARHVAEFARTGATARAMGRPGQLIALRRDGSEFPIEATISQVVVAGRRLLTVILRDTSERVRAENERRAATERLACSSRRLEAIRDIERAILAATRLDQLAAEALGRLLPLVGTDEVDLVLTSGDGEARAHRVTAAPGGGPAVTSVLTLAEQPQRAIDQWLALRVRQVEDLAEGTGDLPGPLLDRRADGMSSYLGTPLVADGRQLGRLELWRRAPGEFSAETREIAAELGNQLAIAIQQARLRADLHRHAEDLEARVAERTRALQDVNAELNSFAYSVSHDLRTPLRSMQGFAEALLEDYTSSLDDTGKDYARRIVAASRRMDHLIQDLLTYSRLSRAELELRPVALGTLIRAIALQVEEQAQAATPPVHPRIDVVEPMPAVLGHRGVLSQVIQNLLTNAIKFVAPGVVPHVTIAAQATDGRVRVSVTDNGIGVAAEHQERIFRVFERLHRLEAYPGTGIGLAIVRKGVERLGGRCGVESTPGAGSRFWLDLPAADPASAPPGDHLDP